MRETVRVRDGALRDRLEQVVALARACQQRARVVGPHAALRREQRAARVGVALRAGVAQQRDDAFDGGQVERRRRGRPELHHLERQARLRPASRRQANASSGFASSAASTASAPASSSRPGRDGVPQRAAHVEDVGERDQRAHVLRERLERGGHGAAVERVDDAPGERRAGPDVRRQRDVLARGGDPAHDRAPLAFAHHAAAHQPRQERGRREGVARGQAAFVDQKHAHQFGRGADATLGGVHRSVRSLWTDVEPVDG